MVWLFAIFIRLHNLVQFFQCIFRLIALDFTDSAYTEKFMSTPQLNPEGYTLTSNILRAANITSDFLLIHGTWLRLYSKAFTTLTNVFTNCRHGRR